MQVSKSFLRDFAYLANRYEWTAADIEEMKAAVHSNEDAGRQYITTLAAAHRAGYEQTRDNGYMRLHAWCAEQGWPDAYASSSQEVSCTR
jgi:hypothetical protein